MFVITSNPATRQKTWTSPLWWTGSQVVGILRANEAQVFDTPEAADLALNVIPDRVRQFYDLAVAPSNANDVGTMVGNNGWMVGHPGYDLS